MGTARRVAAGQWLPDPAKLATSRVLHNHTMLQLLQPLWLLLTLLLSVLTAHLLLHLHVAWLLLHLVSVQMALLLATVCT
jgi:hypothetical protein